MKTLLPFIPLLIGLLFCLSCNNKKTTQIVVTESEKIPVIDLEKALDHISGDQVNFSEFIEDITYVPLETNDKSIFGPNRFLEPRITANYIFPGEILFRKDGSFVRKLGKKGQGPGEYLLALGMATDEKRQEFYINDNYLHDIFVYDFENHNIIWPFNQQFSYYEFFTDTIFSLDNGIVSTPRFSINSGKYKFTVETMHKMDRNAFITIEERQKYIQIGQIAECNRFLFFSLYLHKTLYYAAYDKITGETKINEFSKFFNNDIDGGFLWLFRNTANGQEGFYEILPYIAKERIDGLSSQNKGYDKEKNKKLRQLIDNLADDDNICTYFFHFK